jgi:hypothetical protein
MSSSSISAWLNWRTGLASVLIATLISVALFSLTDVNFSLSGLDLFFAVTTAISLAFNLWQLIRDKYKYAPLKNSLVGLFNDLKGRQLRAHQRILLITTPEGMSLDVEATRIQFYDFVQEMIQSLEQLREHVVASIHTVDPEVSNQHVFRAGDFGLTDQERKFKEEALQRFHQQARTAGAPGTPAAPGATPR